jgi:hypothetical protein
VKARIGAVVVDEPVSPEEERGAITEVKPPLRVPAAERSALSADETPREGDDTPDARAKTFRLATRVESEW